MRKHILTFAAVVVLICSAASAQQGLISHSPASCLPANEFSTMSAIVNTPGSLRLYFRNAGAEDWCYVTGTRVADRANYVLPKFPAGTQLEYFFVVLDGEKVIARSPQMYRVPVAAQCGTPAARRIEIVQTDCEKGGASIGSALGAAYLMENPPSPQPPSPSVPNQ